MQLSNQQTLPVNQQQAWDALNDVSLLQASIPGCDRSTSTPVIRSFTIQPIRLSPTR